MGVYKHKVWAVEMLNITVPEKEAEKAPEVQNSLHNYFTMPDMARSLELIGH